MSSNNFGFGDNYPPVSNRTQTSQSSHQNYPTSNATTAPYYGLQSTEAAAKTYASNDYQYGQYGQTGASSNSNLDNWGNYRNTTATGAYSTGSLESVDQRLLNATRAPAQSNYDSSSLSNLGYGSNLAYGTAADTAQPASDYSSTSLYSGTTQNTTAQRNTQYDQPQTQTRPAATAQRVALPASQGQRQAETTPRTNTTASYNLPTPSPTYPQGLINPYPGNAASASLSRGAAASNARVKETTTAQTTAQQPSYTQNTSYGNTQQQARTRLSPEQMRKTQTPTPPVPPIRMVTPESRTAASSAQAYYQQPAQNPSTQSASQTRARTQPASSLKTAPVNVIMPSAGQPQPSPKRAPAGQRDMYQPQQTSATTVQARKIGNFRSDPSRASSMYQQQQAQSRSEPAQDQPTSVDPSLVYNRYHEYQQQIKEAEAEAAKLATIEEEKKAAEAAEKRKAEAAKSKEEAEATRIEKQRKQQQAKAAQEAKAAEKARQTAGKARKKKEAQEAAAATKAAVEAAQTLAQDMHHQTNFGMNAPQEVQAGEGEESEKYMEAQAGDEQDEDYVDEEQHQQRQPVNTFQQQRGTPAHKPILPPQYQSTPQSRPPQQQNNETPANDAELTAMMEEEMRKTVERLRDFQAKDPKLFLKVWSSVRKSGTGPGQSPQPNGEGSQPQQSPAMGSAAMASQPALTFGAGPSNQENTYQNDGSQPQQYIPVPAPKKKRVKKPKQSLEAQTAATQNQENQPQTQEPQSQAQGPQQQQQQFRSFADDFHTGEVLAPGESIVMQTKNPQQPLSKNKRGRPSNAEKALREMQRANELPPVKRPPGRPKGSKTKKKPAEGEVVDQAPIATPPTPPMQPAGPGSFGRLVPHAPSATAAERAAFNEQSQQALQANNAQLKSTGRMLNAAQPSPAVTAVGANSQSPSQVQQSGSSPAPRSATMGTIEQAKAAPIGAPAPVQNQTAQWPDEHIDLIADTGSKLLKSLPQNAGKIMESSTIRDMLRTNPSYVQVCEMIESKGFYMDRSKFARTLLAVISPNQSTPANPQGHQPPQNSQAGASPGVSGSQQNIGPQPRNLSSAAAAMRAHKEGLLPNTSPLPQQQLQPQPQPQPKPAPKPSRPNQVYQPPKYGELGTRPVEERSFVREDTTQSQGATQPTQPTMEEKGKSYASPYQQLRPDDSDDYAPAPMEEDDRDDEQMLSRLKAFNESQSTQQQIPKSHPRGTLTPYRISSGTVPNQMTASGSTQPSAGQPAARSTYLGNGVYRHPNVNGQNTRSHSTSPYLYQSQFSTPNAAASVPQERLGGRPPQLSYAVHPLSDSAPRVPTPVRPWGKPNNALSTGGDSALKRPHSEAFGSNIHPLSQPPSSFRPNPFGNRINSASEMGSARAAPFNAGASPFRVTSTTPQPQMPTQASNKTYQALYSQPYLQVNTVEETATASPHHIARNPLLNFNQIILPIDTSIARRRNHYDPKTIARDVLLGSGKGPFRPLNAHLEVLKKFKAVDNQSDLSTFRWDIVDPGGDEVGSYNKEIKDKMAAQRRGAVPSRGNPFGMSSRPKTPSGLRNETLEIEDVDAMDIDDEEPARAHSKGTTPGRPGRQARNPAPNYKGMTAAELKGLKQDAGRRYREGSEQTPAEAAKAPRKGLQYVEFACKWEGCSHVLLNLATLRRHIFTLHGSNDDVVHPGKVCMWHGCGNKDYSAEHDETPGTHFDKLKDFKQHMEDTHLKSVARLYGDGPKSDVYDNDSDFGSSATSSYLFDETGRQVTPSVHAGNGNAGQATVKGNPGFINEARVRKIKREERRKDRILAYWNIENFECQPLRLDGSLSTGGLSREALGRYLRAQGQLEEQYGDELAEAAKLNQGMSKASEKRVYAKNMPKKLRKKLGV